MREKIFKWLFRKEYFQLNDYKDKLIEAEGKVEKVAKQIVLLEDVKKQLDGEYDELKKSNRLYSIGHLKNIELRDALYNYITQVKSGNLNLEDNNYGIDQAHEDSNKKWKVDTAFCQIGGCTVHSEKFEIKSCAEVFASLMTILGEEPATSLCWMCKEEYDKTLY